MGNDISRAHFIKKTLLTLSPLLLSQQILSGCKKENKIGKGKKVIVAGAGMAGLAAAAFLQKKGFDVSVLEAQAHIGGRLLTDRSTATLFDEGASWIHGPIGNPISTLAKQAGASTYITNDDSVIVYQSDGTPYNEALLQQTESDYYEALQQITNSSGVTDSFETVFNQLYPTNLNNDLWKFLISSYLEFDTGADMADLSAKYFDDDTLFFGADEMIINGYDRLATNLASGLHILLNSAITKIDYAQNTCIVHTGTEMHQADFVVVTVPLGVLKNNDIQFLPVLPISKTNAINRLKMGTVNKFLLEWGDCFWDPQVQYIGYTASTKGKFNYFLNYRTFSSANALMTFAFGKYSVLTETMTDSAIQNEIMNHLKAIYGNSIPSPTHFRRTKWNSQAYTRGSYSFVAAGSTSDDFATLAHPVNNRLFFAGEHTSQDYRGTVHGAYISGISAASAIVDVLEKV